MGNPARTFTLELNKTYTVPLGINAIAVDIQGAKGGDYPGHGVGGGGGRVQATLAVTGGQVFYIYLGNVGQNGVFTGSLPVPAGGTESGGGADGGGGSYSDGGSGGGAASDLRTLAGNSGAALSSRVIVAGGGGGGAWNSGEVGGQGGGLTGGNGFSSGTTPFPAPGDGGTQTNGGPAEGGAPATAGGFGPGGNAAPGNFGSGGGGGWWGGGGAVNGSGGGGSSFPAANGGNISSLSHTQGYNNTGTGICIITPLFPNVAATPTPLAFGSVASGATVGPLIFSFTGSILTGSALTLTPPANYMLSTDNVTYGLPGAAITFTYTGSAFTSVPVYVKFTAPVATGPYNGNIAVTGGGLSTTYNIPVTATSAAACSGTPTTGGITINGGASASGTSSAVFTLNAPTVTTGGGITYQWQSSPTGVAGSYTNIPGANSVPYTYTGITGNTWFQLVVTCATGSSAVSGAVTATYTFPGSSCVPTCNFGSTSFAAGTSGSPVLITGASGSSISDASLAGSGTGGSIWYYNNVATTVNFTPGGSFPVTMGISGNCYQTGQVWIDFNDNGQFETSESVGGYAFSTSCPTGRPTFNIVVPSNAQTGAHRMRVLNGYTGDDAPGVSSFYPFLPKFITCPTAATINYADARDYTAIIAPPPPVITTIAVAPFGNVTVGTSSVPYGFTTISGSGLVPAVGLITITAPGNFLVSLNGTSWSSSILLPYSGSTLPSTNIYVEFNPTAAITYNGNIVVSGGRIPATLNIAVTGNGQNLCSGTPIAGTAVVNPTLGGSTNLFTLSLPSPSAARRTYLSVAVLTNRFGRVVYKYHRCYHTYL